MTHIFTQETAPITGGSPTSEHFFSTSETYEGGYENYGHFNGVIRNYHSRVFDPQQILHIPLGYAIKPRGDGIGQVASERLYRWSFAGAARKASRPDMLRYLDEIGPHCAVITDAPVRQEFLTAEAMNCVLADSMVVPCPMGNVNLESFRVYEALEAGCIPIVEKRFRFDYFTKLLGTNPIPKVRSWSQGASILRDLCQSPSSANRLQEECWQWWSQRKADISIEIECFIGTREKQKCSHPFLPGSIPPGWRLAELVRHHSALALCRRAKAQITRIITEKRIRATYGR